MRFALTAIAAALILSACATSKQPTVAEVDAEFRGTFKNMPVEKVTLSEIEGVYEVYSGGKLFYYAPKPKLMLFGEFYSTNGVSVTQEKVDAFLKERTLAIPADVGTRVGDGPTEVIAFLDPNCGHCVQAHDWMEQRNFEGMTLRVIFLAMQPNSTELARAQQFVCAPPHLKREALAQVYSREEAPPGQVLLNCPEAAPQLARQAQIAKELGVNGTPTFSLKGQTVLGFHRDRLESLLQQSPSTSQE